MVKKKTTKSRNVNTINVLDNNNIRITLIVCATALIIFLFYNFTFSDYARCMSVEKEKIQNHFDGTYYSDKKRKAEELKKRKHSAKNRCVILTGR